MENIIQNTTSGMMILTMAVAKKNPVNMTTTVMMDTMTLLIQLSVVMMTVITLIINRKSIITCMIVTMGQHGNAKTI